MCCLFSDSPLIYRNHCLISPKYLLRVLKHRWKPSTAGIKSFVSDNLITLAFSGPQNVSKIIAKSLPKHLKCQTSILYLVAPNLYSLNKISINIYRIQSAKIYIIGYKIGVKYWCGFIYRCYEIINFDDNGFFCKYIKWNFNHVFLGYRAELHFLLMAIRGMAFLINVFYISHNC